MTLSHHIDSFALQKKVLKSENKTHLSKTEQYVFRYSGNHDFPRTKIPDFSNDGQQVYEALKEGLSLDGNPTLNLASFVNTELDEIPLKLINDNLVKNLADNDEYPSLIDTQNRCISIISNLWNAPKQYDENGNVIINTIGAATTGSSEAIMLAGLAMKKSWQLRQKEAGKPANNPNIIMASCAQVALEKFALYFDVENRLIPIRAASNHLIDVTKIKENIDENTIGIFVIMGSTFTGAFEPVEKISELLDEVEKETGLDIKIHVDGASGGFVAPFVYPHLKWDFAIDRVVSINTSGHKFGLTTAGLGWVIWRDSKYLPENLRFKLDYLGGIEETFGLNFSRPGFTVVHQYYNLITYGREGYSKIYRTCLQNARYLSDVLIQSGYFEVLSVIHKKITPKEKAATYTRKVEPTQIQDVEEEGDTDFNEDYEPGLPVVAFRFNQEIREKYPEIPQSIFSMLLRNKGFIVPNYHLPPDENETEILRVVVRKSLSMNLMQKLCDSIIQSIELLIGSCQDLRDVAQKANSPEEANALIFDLLLSIASGGDAELKKQQLDAHNASDAQKGHSFRGPC